MTRTYAAKRLLEHGPLTFTELKEITGWSHNAARGAIWKLVDQGIVNCQRIDGWRKFVLA